MPMANCDAHPASWPTDSEQNGSAPVSCSKLLGAICIHSGRDKKGVCLTHPGVPSPGD